MNPSMAVVVEHGGTEVRAQATLEVVDQAIADDVELVTSRRLLVDPPLPDHFGDGTDVTITEVDTGRVTSGIVHDRTRIEII